jgi:hypothetical protein
MKITFLSLKNLSFDAKHHDPFHHPKYEAGYFHFKP